MPSQQRFLRYGIGRVRNAHPTARGRASRSMRRALSRRYTRALLSAKPARRALAGAPNPRAIAYTETALRHRRPATLPRASSAALQNRQQNGLDTPSMKTPADRLSGLDLAR